LFMEGNNSSGGQSYKNVVYEKVNHQRSPLKAHVYRKESGGKETLESESDM